MRNPLLLVTLLLLALPVLAQEPEQPIKTTICAIKADPLVFNKKLVEVSGFASHGFEDSMFEDPTCFWGDGRPGIWMEYGGTAATDTMYCCGVTPSKEKRQLVLEGITVNLIRDPLFDRFDRLLHPQQKGPMKDITIQAVVRARIFAQNISLGNLTRIGGYGHMGCCMMLAIEQVIEVKSTKPGPSIFDLAKKAEATPASKP